jgi:hypothetical protein
MNIEEQLKASLENLNDLNKKFDAWILAYRSMLVRLDQIEKALHIDHPKCDQCQFRQTCALPHVNDCSTFKEGDLPASLFSRNKEG